MQCSNALSGANRFVRKRLSTVVCMALSMGAMMSPLSAVAEESDVEVVVVTGSHIKGNSEQMAVPIEVVSRDDLKDQGMPNITEMVLNMPWMSGTVNQSEQFQSNGEQTGTKNVNMRGLGKGRTLVLLNNKRMILTGPSNDQGEAPVDIGNFPSIALDRIEVLKNGGSTLYGSDAIGGVFNYKTRGHFEGFEIESSNSGIDGSSDNTFGAIWGTQGDNFSVVASVEHEKRTRLSNPEADLVNYRAPDDGGWFLGVSGLGNPGTLWNPAVLDGAGYGGPLPDWADSRTMYQADPACGEQNGASHSIPMTPSIFDPANYQWSACGYNFMPFSNVIDPQERLKVFVEATVDVGDAELYGDLMWASLDADYYSPASFPPTQAGYFYYVPWNNPGLQDFLTDVDPDYAANYAYGATMYGRAKAVNDPSSVSPRDHETMRITTGMRGDLLADSISYDIGLAYSQTEATTKYRDVLTARFNAALVGFGGKDCDGVVAGQGDCMFFNPFSSASSNPDLANDPELWEWIHGESGWNIKKSGITLDAIFSGDSGIELGGGTMAWAAGGQYRTYKSDRTPFGHWVADTPAEPTPYHFLGTAVASEKESDVWSAFAEFRLPVTEWAEVTTALRHESYGDDSTTNPAVSMAITASEDLMIRTSFERSFRVPSSNGTTNSVALAEGEYVLWENTDENRKPEEADSFNVGFVYTPNNNLDVGVDFYRVKLSGPFAGETIENVLIADDPSQVFRDDLGQLQKIITHSNNGPDTTTAGIDFSATWRIPSELGTWSLGTEGNYVERYKIDSYTTGDGREIASYDAAGNWNVRSSASAYPLWAMPKLKANLHAGITTENHFLRIYARYVDGYDLNDEEANVAEFKARGYGDKVDSWVTFDAHYSYSNSIQGNDYSIGVSMINLTGEKPPLVPFELAYDPSTHNAVGQVLKATMKVSF